MYISPLGVLALCTILVIAHDHEEMVAGPYVNNFRNDEPMDATIKVHIALQMSSWTMLSFGMVLGIAKSRWHVPTQVVSIVTTLFASFLAHHHGGRSFHHTAHATLANLLFYYVVIQAGLGTFLRLHIWEASRGRKIAKKAHSIVGKTFPVLGFAQMLLGGITSLGFCASHLFSLRLDLGSRIFMLTLNCVHDMHKQVLGSTPANVQLTLVSDLLSFSTEYST